MCDIHFRESYEYNKSKLWTAPEYLRQEDRVFSRAGDIYSLGVILHEIIERAGVWALNTNTNEDDDEDYLEPKVRVALYVKMLSFPPFTTYLWDDVYDILNLRSSKELSQCFPFMYKGL